MFGFIRSDDDDRVFCGYKEDEMRKFVSYLVPVLMVLLAFAIVFAPSTDAQVTPQVFEPARVILEDGAPFLTFDKFFRFHKDSHPFRPVHPQPAADWCAGLCDTECGGSENVVRAKLLRGSGGCATLGCGCQCVGDPGVVRLDGECY